MVIDIVKVLSGPAKPNDGAGCVYNYVLSLGIFEIFFFPILTAVK